MIARGRALTLAAAWLALGALAAGRKEKRMLALSSPAFKDGQPIPAKHTCDGQDLSPALRFSGVPAEAKALALIVDDPDAPAGVWVHWVLYDLPAAEKGLPEALPKREALASGARQGLGWGVDAFERVGYYGPCPPPGPVHRYVFTLYALKQPTGLPPRATKPQLLRAMDGLILGQARLVGTYRRPTER